jgi:hypothetical protein
MATKSSCHPLLWTGLVSSATKCSTPGPSKAPLSLEVLIIACKCACMHAVCAVSFLCTVAASLHIEYPMLFKVSNNATGNTTHCGVLEFIAQEGHVYLPRWVSSSTGMSSVYNSELTTPQQQWHTLLASPPKLLCWSLLTCRKYIC